MRETFVDPRNGKLRTFASRQAVEDYIAKLVRAQKRLVEGVTVKDNSAPAVCGPLRHGRNVMASTSLRKVTRKGYVGVEWQ